MSVQYYKDTAHMLWQSYRYVVNGQADIADVQRWLQLGREALEGAETLATSQGLSTSDKQKLQAAVAFIKSALVLLSEDSVAAANSEPSVSEVNNEHPNELSSELLTDSEQLGSVQGGDLQAEPLSWDELNSAFENRIRTAVITNNRHLDISKFLKDAQRQFVIEIQKTLERHNALKVNTVLAAEFSIVKDDVEVNEIKYFNTKTSSIYLTTDLAEWFQLNIQQPIDQDVEDFQERDSGWSLRTVLNLVVNINKFTGEHPFDK